MFKINDSVIHCREGLSTIVSINNMNGRDYFLVSVDRNSGETIYVPVIGAQNIVRPILSVEEADKLLKEVKAIEKDFNSNTKQRRDAYKRRLGSGKVEDMAYLYRQAYLYEKYPEGVKLGPTDLDMLNYATNFILEEMALTYDIDRMNIADYLINRIENL